MSNGKRKTKVKDKQNLAGQLNDFASRTEGPAKTREQQIVEEQATSSPALETAAGAEADKTPETKINEAVNRIFDRWEEQEFTPEDYQTDIPADSMEASIGYSSLLRQMHTAFRGTVAFYRSKAGGSLSVEQARAAAFHACTDREEAVKLFDEMLSLPLDVLNFTHFEGLQSYSPRVAEEFWEMVKREGRKEFESGHLAANINFPVGYMKEVWNIARYLGVRESFIDDWQPTGGIEIALVDMIAQSYFQWQYWLEQTVKRSQTRVTETHPEYQNWLNQREREYKANGWVEGFWHRPLVSEQEALDKAVQMADRFNRIFMRTLRQLRDLRRYSPVTINNPSQVNIAADGGQQINISKSNEVEAENINS